ncbi:MAG: mechanosensitive ion channel domain-containing protein [Bacteroidales bacterium]|nr:mechanosensitive ion channel [Bacteroidales bacterium]
MTMDITWIDELNSWLKGLGLDGQAVNFIVVILILIGVFLLAYLADYLAKNVLVTSVKRLVKKSPNKWDDVLISRKVIQRFSHLAPALIVYFAVNILLVDFPTLSSIIKSGLYIYVVFIVLLTLDALLSAFHDIYQTFPIAQERPIKGYIQVTKIIIHSVGGILIISELLGKSPTGLLASLGALAAVLVLVFRDTILGFVSSIQLSANQMVKPGDWISMPSKNADGIVIDITVNTVKVRNWDKTISTIPTYALISESFQNWKGMEESKGRRIARSVYIDIKSISFCNEEMLDRFKKFRLIRDYIITKQEEIEAFNKAQGITREDTVTRRRLTNVGVFRKYVQTYLEKHQKIHPNEAPYIIMVRHLQPTEKGLPIQIYCFSKEVQWKAYEMVQADIFDHILAVISEFGLRVFQSPSSDDFRALTGRDQESEG